MSRALLGVMAGAGGATAYYSLPDLQATVKMILNAPRTTGPTINPDMDGLRSMVEQLTREMRRGHQPVMIVNGSSTGSTISYALYGGAFGAALYAYLRFVKGWSLGDLMYVTRSSLNKSLTSMTEGMDSIQKRLNNVKTYLMEQIKHLSTKQDETMKSQEELKSQLGQVGHDVEGTRAEVTMVHDAVRALESTVDHINGSLEYTNQGIHVLCRVVGDLLRGGNRHSMALRDLDAYLKASPPVLCEGERIQGLGCLVTEPLDDKSAGGIKKGNTMFIARGPSGQITFDPKT